MRLWPFARRTTSAAPMWRDLTDEQRVAVARRLAETALSETARHYGKGYEAVTYPFSAQRRPSYVETTGEDGQLTNRQRNRLVDLQRDMMRNSPTRGAQDQQIRVNVVGSVGGKLYASFPEGYEDAAQAVMNHFNRVWAPHAEFSFGRSFNWLLKTALTAMDTNGNLILVFDDGFLTGGNGTGLVRGFEGDEIAGISDEDFAALWPKGYSQSAGFVYNPSGMFSGAFVSSLQRGADTFERGKFVTLRRDPFSRAPCNWIALGEQRRFNQGRAISPLTAALTCLVDLHETISSEAQAAKLNSQIVGQILQDASADVADAGAYAATTSADGSSEFSTRQLTSIGARFDQMPPGQKIELLDTKRPNANMPAYVEFLTGLVGGTKGLARVYATLKAQTSYTAFRGEQVMSWPSFEEAQKDLERNVCDWVAVHVIERAVRMGEITAALPDGWQTMLAWQWPKMREVSQTDAENAFATGLRNGSVTFFDRFGPDWENRCIRQRATEVRKFREAGLVYPGDKDVNGQDAATEAAEKQPANEEEA